MAAVPDNVEQVTSTILDSLLTIWADFVAHIPYIVGGLIALSMTWAAVSLVNRFSHLLLGRWGIRQSLKDLLTRLMTIAVWLIGLLFTTMIVFPGLTPTKALGGLGLVSIAVGFAFKDIFENFFAGILLLWRFPFENGDFVECEGIEGRIEDITIRMTKIRRTSGELVVVPNSFLFKNPVHVLTADRVRRAQIVTGVAYGEDVTASVEVIRKAVESCETVNAGQPIQIFPREFGASSIDIEVSWWAGSKPVEMRESRAEVVTAIKAALDKAGIEIPFPYRTLTFKESLTIGYPAHAEDH